MLILPLLLSLLPEAHASYRVISRQRDNIQPAARGCEANRSCGLAWITRDSLTKEISVHDELYYSTDTRVGYETKPGTPIEDYVFVQLIKGCIYTRLVARDGSSSNIFDVSREYWGGHSVFRHPEWAIDNTDASPFYTSYGEHGPYALLRWNANPSVQDPDNDPYYVARRPPHRTVYMTDFPGPSYVTAGANGARALRLSSLQFRTCLLHKDFVDPHSPADGSGVQFEKAVKCFEWSSNFRYNETSRRLEMASELDPVCADG